MMRRPCPEPGCSALTESGRCDEHRPERYKRRGTTAERGYGSDWQKVRALKLAEDPICQMLIVCKGEAATEVHHRIRINDAPALRLERSNLISSCKPCHERVESDKRARKL